MVDCEILHWLESEDAESPKMVDSETPRWLVSEETKSSRRVDCEISHLLESEDAGPQRGWIVRPILVGERGRWVTKESGL